MKMMFSITGKKLNYAYSSFVLVKVIFKGTSKLIGVIENEEDVMKIQKDIDNMQSWTKRIRV